MKQEFVQQKVKQGYDKAEVEKDWESFEKLFKEKGLEDDELQKRIRNRMISYYLKKDLTTVPTEEFTGICVGMKETDFGARFAYAKAIQVLQSQGKELAIEQGLVNIEGQPIYTTGFNKGNIIDLDNKQYQYFGLFQKKGDKNWITGQLNISSKNIKEQPKFFEYFDFKAAVNNKSTKDFSILNATSEFRIKNVHRINDEETMTLLKQNFADKLCKISELRQVAKDFAENKNYDGFIIVRGNIVQLMDDERVGTDVITQKQVVKPNILVINDTEEEPNIVTCFASPKIKFDFSEDAQDVICIGRPAIGKDEQVIMNLYGVRPQDADFTKGKEFVESEETEEEFSNEEGW